MSRIESVLVPLAWSLVLGWALAPAASAQWFFHRSRGALVNRSGNVARSPAQAARAAGTDPAALSVPSVQVIPNVPAWHHSRQDPFLEGARMARERHEYDVDRMLRYRTREERYADDFRDRYSTGDPFYHDPRGRAPSPEVFDPVAWGHPVTVPPPVPGIGHSLSGPNKRFHLDDTELPDQLRAAAYRLATSLSRMRDGDLWLDELQPRRIVASIDRGEHPASLADLVSCYAGVAENPRFVLIARANGFQETYRWLARYVQLPSRFLVESENWDSTAPIVLHREFPERAPSGSTSLGNEPVEGLRLDAATPPAPPTPDPPPVLTAPEIQLLPAPAGERER